MARRSLTSLVGRGAAFSLVGNFTLLVLSFVSLVLASRILNPESFGGVSLALAIYGVSDRLTDPVFRTMLLRERSLDKKTIDVAWTLGFIRGSVLCVGFYIAAPLIASFFGAPPETERYLNILALTFFASGLFNAHQIRLRRELRYKSAFLLEKNGVAIGSLVTSSGLVMLRQPVALVIGPLVGRFVEAITSWLLVSPLPKLFWDKERFGPLWRFSRFLMLNSVLAYALLNLDDLFVAKVVGLTALGTYVMAFRIVNTIINHGLHALILVLLPAYVKLGSDQKRLQRATLASLSVITVGAAVFCTLLFLFAESFFLVISGDSKWLESATVLRALVPFVIARSINVATSPFFLVKGHPEFLAAISGVQLLLLPLALFAGFSFAGIIGIALGVSILNLMASGAVVAILNQRWQLSVCAFIGTTAPPLLIAAFAGFVGWFCVSGWSSSFWRLTAGSVIVVTVFLAIWEISCRLAAPYAGRRQSLIDLALQVIR